MNKVSYPPPWKLQGKGHIFIYRFPKNFFKEPTFKGGLGALMLVEYENSNVGPYNELLLIPGKFLMNNKRWRKISHIYVSSQVSVEWGMKNWAIPKAYADFSLQKANNISSYSVEKNHQLFFHSQIKNHSFSFPISIKWFPSSLLQPWDDQYLHTTVMGKGKASLSSLRSLVIDDDHFPDVSKLKPLMGFCIHDFQITFPNPKVIIN